MTTRRDPNYLFKHKKHPYASPRPAPGKVLLLRCDATNCGRKLVIERYRWISDEEIPCPNCGSTNMWSTL